MRSRQHYRIGEFARLAGISVKTLRFYDAQGLLKPVKVDGLTRYRSYVAAQLQDLAAIRALQELGASLADIRRVIHQSCHVRERMRLLEKLRLGAKQSLENAQRSLRWIDLALEELSQDLPMVSIVVKRRAEMRVATVRARLGSYDAVSELESDLRAAIAPEFTRQTRGVLWHRCEASGAIDGEPFIEVSPRTPRSRRYEMKELPGTTVASAFCEATDDSAVRTYDAIDRWVRDHDYRIAGAKRELYVGNLLEVQFPLAPA